VNETNDEINYAPISQPVRISQLLRAAWAQTAPPRDRPRTADEAIRDDAVLDFVYGLAKEVGVTDDRLADEHEDWLAEQAD
jgi:hypothetical protein